MEEWEKRDDRLQMAEDRLRKSQRSEPQSHRAAETSTTEIRGRSRRALVAFGAVRGG